MKVEKPRPKIDVQSSAATRDEPKTSARVATPLDEAAETQDTATTQKPGEALDPQVTATQFTDGVTTVVETSAAPAVAPRRSIFTRKRPRVVIDDRLGRLALSLVLAILLWFYVANLENPAQTTSFKGLNVEVRGTGQNLRIINSLPTVEASIQAPQNLMTNLRQADVHPYIDIRGLAAGVHEVPVRVETNGLQGGSVSASVDPGQVQVQLEIEATKVFSVVVQLNGTPAMGYRTDVPQVEPGSVRVTGAQDAVNRIKQVIVPVDVDAKASTQQGQRNPVAIDDAGKEVTGVTFDPPTVQVSVPIKLLFNYKSVPVRVPIVGQPAPGLAPVVKWQPTNVTVCCSPSVLESLQSLETVPVGITGTTSSVVTTTELILPPDVELYPGQSRVISVTVDIEVLQSTLDIPVAPTVAGLPPGYVATISPDRISVTLAGTFNQLQSISPSDVKAIVDVSGRGAGTFDLPLQTTAPQGVRVQGLSQDKVTVTLIAPTPIPPTPTLTVAPTPSTAPTIEPTATVPEVLPPTIPIHTLTPTPTLTHTPTLTPITTPSFTPTVTAVPASQTPTRPPTALPPASATQAPPSPTMSPSPTLPQATATLTVSPTATPRLAVESNP